MGCGRSFAFALIGFALPTVFAVSAGCEKKEEPAATKVPAPTDTSTGTPAVPSGSTEMPAIPTTNPAAGSNAAGSNAVSAAPSADAGANTAEAQKLLDQAIQYIKEN